MPGNPAATVHPLSVVDNTEADRNRIIRKLRHTECYVADAVDAIADGETVSATEYLELIRSSLSAEIERLEALNTDR